MLPAGAIDSATRHWHRQTGKFLFPHQALAKVFWTKWFAAMKEIGWAVRADLRTKWVVDCQPVGNGDQALIYLGRYLYRGVLPERHILRHAGVQVTCRYTDNTLPGIAPRDMVDKKIFLITGSVPIRRARPTTRTTRGSLRSHELSLFASSLSDFRSDAPEWSRTDQFWCS